jgi:hypothetical protein
MAGWACDSSVRDWKYIHTVGGETLENMNIDDQEEDGRMRDSENWRSLELAHGCFQQLVLTVLNS